MAYQTFSLKYRPQTFEEIVGQEHVATTLKNAVAEGRVAHGYLFAGPRGTGKTSAARVLAKALNCEKGPTPEPCGECSICQDIAAGRAMDVIEIDAASTRGIDPMRDLREKVKYAPAQARCKVYILDEAHMLTDAASNALLKTLEEPPEHAYFILATTEAHNVLPTIKSRCQHFEFRPIPLVLLIESLKLIAQAEGVKAEEAALGAIARAANGAMRDAQSIFDQVIAYSPGEITTEVVKSVLGITEAEMLAHIADVVADSDLAGCFAAVDEAVSGGKDIGQLLDDLALYFRDLLRLSLSATPPAWMQIAEANRERMSAQAAKLGTARISAIVQRLAEAAEQLKSSSQHALLLELTLAELCVPAAPAAAPRPSAKVVPAAAAKETEQAPSPQPPPPEPTVTEEMREEPPAEEVSADQPLDLDLVQAHWARMLVALREIGHVSLGALLSEKGIEPAAVEADHVTLTFPPDCEFHYSQAQGRYRLLLEEALERVYKRPLQLTCLLAGEAPASEAATQTPTAQEQDRAVEQVLSLFEGSREVTQE